MIISSRAKLAFETQRFKCCTAEWTLRSAPVATTSRRFSLRRNAARRSAGTAAAAARAAAALARARASAATAAVLVLTSVAAIVTTSAAATTVAAAATTGAATTSRGATTAVTHGPPGAATPTPIYLI